MRAHRRMVAVSAVAALGLAAGCGASDGAGRTGDRAAAPVSRTSAPVSVAGASPSAVPDLPLRPGERFATIGLPGGRYTPHADTGTDDYRCFLIDPHLARDAFITGVQFQPGNPAVVHHAILFRVQPGQVSAAQHRDSAYRGEGWTCFGGTGVAEDSTDPISALDAAPWLAAWAPGGHEQLSPAGVGVEVEAGTQIVLQVHYNLRGGRGPDSTHVRLRLAPPAARLQPLSTMLLPAPVELPCASTESGPLCDRAASLRDLAARFGPQSLATVAGLQLLCGGNPVAPRASLRQSCDRRVTEPAVIRAVAGHMHRLGRTISVVVNPGTPRAQTVLDIRAWDFDDQSARSLSHPVRINPGDTIRVTCAHDPQLRQLVGELRDLSPRYVTWGEGTSDEMCLGILMVTKP